MSEDQINIKDIAKVEKLKLEKQVKNAFENRRIEHYVPELGMTQEMFNEHKKFNDFLEGKPNGEVVGGGVRIQKPYEAIVRNSHQYLELLKQSIKIVRPIWADDEDYIQAEAEYILEHEFKHAVPELGFDESNVLYGVHFYEDEDSKESNMFPFITVEGETTIGRIRDSITNVDEMSEGDKIIMKDTNNE